MGKLALFLIFFSHVSLATADQVTADESSKSPIKTPQLQDQDYDPTKIHLDGSKNPSLSEFKPSADQSSSGTDVPKYDIQRGLNSAGEVWNSCDKSHSELTGNTNACNSSNPNSFLSQAQQAFNSLGNQFQQNSPQGGVSAIMACAQFAFSAYQVKKDLDTFQANCQQKVKICLDECSSTKYQKLFLEGAVGVANTSFSAIADSTAKDNLKEIRNKYSDCEDKSNRLPDMLATTVKAMGLLTSGITQCASAQQILCANGQPGTAADCAKLAASLAAFQNDSGNNLGFCPPNSTNCVPGQGGSAGDGGGVSMGSVTSGATGLASTAGDAGGPFNPSVTDQNAALDTPYSPPKAAGTAQSGSGANNGGGAFGGSAGPGGKPNPPSKLQAALAAAKSMFSGFVGSSSSTATTPGSGYGNNAGSEKPQRKTFGEGFATSAREPSAAGQPVRTIFNTVNESYNSQRAHRTLLGQ